MLDVQAKARVYDYDAGHCQIAWRTVFVCNTIAQATTANITSLVRNFETFAQQRHERPIAFLLLTQPSTSPPSAPDRKRVIDALGRHAEKLGGVGICLSAEGFVGAALRSVASAVFLLPRTRYEVQFFSRPTEAASWAARLAGCSADDVMQLIQMSSENIARAQ